MNIFDPEIIEGFFQNYYRFFNLAVFLVSFGLTYYLIPKVLWVVREKQLYKQINERSSHKDITPTLGGVAFFMVFVFIISLLQSFSQHATGNHLIIAILFMFIVGVKDDLVVSMARVKLVGQLLATALVVFSPDLQIVSLHGFMEIYRIPPMMGYLIAAFIIISLINAYNLIDGINGLAGIIGIVITSVYAVSFYLIQQRFYAMICLMIAGTLLAYLRYNFSRSDKKIFMGDSGSLMIGLLLGVLTIKLMKVNLPISYIGVGGEPENRIWFMMAVLFVLFFDTSRVILVRLWKRKNPFQADRNHVHHILLNLGFNHFQSSMILGMVNILIVILYVIISTYLSTPWIIGFLFTSYIGCFALCEVVLKRNFIENRIK